ncbi:hypothetical protein AJ80_04998 [Polytolypa hystricis UAMH7299]|uniref:DUF7732 domain-containing protein n=1 Tax=Polytolypa hystricis (strain UAMH7299) TaxID=1447883 RepID=A0A2B7Y6V7_POLH7|nr:hypothetical protein AJ80_04998 [Polytolypa hystricis UAMH7299]
MRFSSRFALCALFTLLALSLSTVSSRSIDVEATDIAIRDIADSAVIVDAPKFSELEKRRGGGGRGGGRGRSGGKSGGRTGSGGTRSPTNPGSRGTSTSSNVGGTSRYGSGQARSYGGGSYYRGGASVPYTSGGKSPRGLMPFMLLPVAALAFFPGLWLYGAYAYHNTPYRYHNATSKVNETIPVTCLCQKYQVCGCEKNDESDYANSVIKTDENGFPRNTSDVVVATVNDTLGIYINGTLPNGTTAADPSITDSASHPMAPILRLSGYWVMAALVVASVSLL